VSVVLRGFSKVEAERLSQSYAVPLPDEDPRCFSRHRFSSLDRYPSLIRHQLTLLSQFKQLTISNQDYQWRSHQVSTPEAPTDASNSSFSIRCPFSVPRLNHGCKFCIRRPTEFPPLTMHHDSSVGRVYFQNSKRLQSGNFPSQDNGYLGLFC